ncbi:epoxide hydrolase A-like isoform X2 [Jatropha curcas]|uniref:epoxide hydrolase A-like isoform X1 n=1 Tax=Jatropha curcas TaxID=180498 RepID=UPI0018957216|nr:epoxide hydrolase A-like isoform X1 [Jatropha curcas]XP_037491362.1 epoxide hydrolase A-like isoform X2 [Jatropha curcas]
MEAIEHKTVNVNGINMHVAELGPVQGPVILFIHGFPELWYSWRHQILALASQGYRAVAPDLRGYGDTDAPADPQSYTCFHIVGDLIRLLDAVAPQQEKVFVVGHDWGALIAWYLCLFRPDRVKALVNLSVPFFRRNPEMKFVDAFRAAYGDDFYMCRFQEYGDIEAEFAELGTERVIKEFLTYRNPGPFIFPKGKVFSRPAGDPIILPSWLSEEEVQYYTTKFDKRGFTGGVNYYRNLDRNWELTAPWTEAQVKVPSKFIVGDEDLVYRFVGIKDYIEKGGFKRDVPILEEVVVMEGVAHFLNQERPGEINNHIYDFFKKF